MSWSQGSRPRLRAAARSERRRTTTRLALEALELRAVPTTFNYATFTPASPLIDPYGNAGLLSDRLQITPNLPSQKGAAYRDEVITLGAGGSFHTDFRFQCQIGYFGSDGFVFMLRGVGSSPLGDGGRDLGYGGSYPEFPGEAITPSVAVEFDTYPYDGYGPYYSLPPHVAILKNGDTANHLAHAQPPFTLNDGTVYHAWVDYDGPTMSLQVFLGAGDTKPAAPLVQTTLDVPALFTGIGGQVYAGFSGATGGGYESQDVLSWSFSQPTPPTAEANGPYAVGEGNIITLDSTGSADPDGPIAAYDWDFNYDGVTFDVDATGPAPSFSAAALDGPTARTVALRVRDDGGLTAIDTAVLTVSNVRPTVAITGAPADSPEGTAIHLAADVTDPGVADTAAGFTYDWSVTRNGNLYASGTDSAFSFVPDDNGTYVVSLTATDKDNGAGTDSKNIIVTNVAPVAAVSGPGGGVRGQTRTVTLGAADPSPVDQAVGFTFTIDWGDDVIESVGGPSGTTADHVYTEAGNYVVRVTATDKDGGVSTFATHAVAIAAVERQGDALVVGGTAGDDTIVFVPAHGLSVVVNGRQYRGFAGVTRVLAFGQAGDDLINGVSFDGVCEFYGGTDNDVLHAGPGGSLLDGGTGADVLLGGRGRDVLLGGDGADQLTAKGDDDLLLAGDFLPAARFDARRADLLAVLGGWSQPTVSYPARVAGLTAFVAARATDDDDVDVLHGGSGLDWFVARTTGANRDLRVGRTSGETVTELA